MIKTCWIWLIFFSNALAKSQHTPQKRDTIAQQTVTDYILIDSGSHFQSKFEFVPQNTRFTLVATQDLVDDLTPEQKLAFDKVVILPHLNFKDVLKAVKTAVPHFKSTRLLVLNESLALMVARVRETLGIPGPTVQSLLPFCDKLESKRRLSNSPVHYPHFKAFDYNAYCLNPNDYASGIAAKLGFPIIVKPNNLSGAHGIKKINSVNELLAWCKHHTYEVHATQKRSLESQEDESNFEFEQYIDPAHTDLFHCDSIIQNGHIAFTQVSIYTHPPLSVTDGKPIGSLTLNNKDPRYEALSRCAKQVIQAFQHYAPIPDGVMHLEAFYDNRTKQVIFLETQLRYPGLETPLAYKIHLNIDLEELHWKLQMGLFTDSLSIKKGPFALWVSIPTQNGVIKSLLLPQKLKSKIHRLQYRIETGDKTTLPEALTLCDHCKKIALRILISNDNYDDIVSDFQYLKHFQPFKLEKATT